MNSRQAVRPTTEVDVSRTKTIAGYLALPYGRVLSREADGRYSASVLEWPGCYGEGETAGEANESLEASMAAWVEVMIEDGDPIPEPLAREYSGKLLLRLSRDTHRALAIRSQAEGVSINHLVDSFVQRSLATTRARSERGGSGTVQATRNPARRTHAPADTPRTTKTTKRPTRPRAKAGA